MKRKREREIRGIKEGDIERERESSEREKREGERERG